MRSQGLSERYRWRDSREPAANYAGRALRRDSSGLMADAADFRSNPTDRPHRAGRDGPHFQQRPRHDRDRCRARRRRGDGPSQAPARVCESRRRQHHRDAMSWRARSENSLSNATRPALKLGVLISGEGTNLQAIIDAIARDELKAEIRVVISNKAAARGLERARRHAIPAEFIDHRSFPSREEFDCALVDALRTHEVELVICAG